MAIVTRDVELVPTACCSNHCTPQEPHTLNQQCSAPKMECSPEVQREYVTEVSDASVHVLKKKSLPQR